MKFTVTQDYLDSCAAIQKIQAPMTSSSVDLNTKATVVVVTYKRPGMLKATIAQLLYQDYPNLEIIVVDGSPNAEEVYRGLDLEVDRNVSYILSKTPNICVMRNLGLLASSGKIIVFIDDDVFICEDFITRHVKLHLTDYGKDAKLVAGHSIGDPREKIQWVKDSVTYCPKGRWARSVYGVNFSVKRRPAIECGGFNPYIPMVGDETELFTRMISDLEEAINGPEVALVHRVSRKGGCRIENKDPHQMARAMSGRLLSRLSLASQRTFGQRCVTASYWKH